MRKQTYLQIGLVGTFLLILLFVTTANSAILHVKTVSAGGNDANSGLDWDHAKASVSAAISAAQAGDEIWVAAGTYQENIQNKVVNVGGVDKAVDAALYGGFAGNESLRDDRNWNTNLTVLDGTFSGAVVSISAGAGVETRIDGFHIINGLGGIFSLGSAPTIANNTIRGNKDSGIYCANYKIIGISPPNVAYPVITGNRIFDNSSDTGAGIAIWGSGTIVHLPPSSPTITYNTIYRNVADYNGGGIGCWGHASPLIANNVILANSAAAAEGSFRGGGGGVYATSNDMADQPVEFAVSAPVIINNVIAANGANLGGGITTIDTDIGVPVIANNTVVANNGAGIWWSTSLGNYAPKIQNNIIAFNTWGLEQAGATYQPIVKNNCVYGNALQGKKTDYKGIADQTGMNGNISVDPTMTNYKLRGFHLQPGSPCIDSGSTDGIESWWKDIDGQNRVIGGGVDIGADESDGTLWFVPDHIIHVRPDGDDLHDGLTWATAKKTVNAGIAAASSTGGEVWVAAGTYTEHIILPAFVYLYGGFVGNETARDNRSVTQNLTVLDGGGISGVVSVKNAGYLVSAVDGFTVQNGGTYSDGDYTKRSGPGGVGGGIYIRVSGPSIANNTINRNSLAESNAYPNPPSYGGGIYCYLCYADIRGNTIKENEVLNTFDGSGGGIYLLHAMPMIEGNTITENHALRGSAIYCEDSSPTITSNTIQNNAMYNWSFSGTNSGAVALNLCEDFTIEGNLIKQNTAQEGAGILITAGRAKGSILNNVITGNITGQFGMGGGIYWEAFYSTDPCYLVNNTITSNQAYSTYGSVTLAFGPGNKMVVANNIIANNWSGIYSQIYPPLTVSNNDVFNNTQNYIGLSSGTYDISVNPGFVNEPAGDFHLNPSSPCIDAGSNSAVPLSLTTDFEGNPRIMDGNNNGTYVVDIGAYEFPGPVLDTTAPTPNPMTWATPPYGANPTSISMVATTATDTGSPPVSYYFHFVSSPTGGTGGSSAGWQGSTSYTNTGLQPNHQYGYQVKARDSASTPNETSYSPTVYKYTLANAPGASSFSNVTQTCIRANWTANGNRSGTEYYSENITAGTNSGWVTGTSWDSCSLTCGTSYGFRVRAKNGDSLESGWTSQGPQMTLACPDTTGPSLSITSHSNDQHVSTSSITLAGTASDSGKGGNGIQQVTVNGARASNDTVVGSATANWSRIVALTPGANTITVIAYDNSPNHNQTSQTCVIYYDVPSIYVSKVVPCSGNPCFSSIQDGIAWASAPSIIKITQDTYYENIILNSDQLIFLQGGWNANFTSKSSFTTIQGSITITHGTMILESISLR